MTNVCLHILKHIFVVRYEHAWDGEGCAEVGSDRKEACAVAGRVRGQPGERGHKASQTEFLQALPRFLHGTSTGTTPSNKLDSSMLTKSMLGCVTVMVSLYIRYSYICVPWCMVLWCYEPLWKLQADYIFSYTAICCLDCVTVTQSN